MRRKGLGRGLDALLGTPEPPAPEAPPARSPGDSAMLPVARLQPNRFQPRTQFDEAGLEDLTESIRVQGIVQPIVATPEPDGKYTIIAGERRWRAAQRAGLTEVPVTLRAIRDERELLELALVENLQRADLNPMEEAEAYRTLGETFGLSQEEVAARVGKGRTTVTNALRLLRLPSEIQHHLREGRLTAGQARPLLALANPEQQCELAARAIREGLTARELEALATRPRTETTPPKKKPELDVHTRVAIEKLTQTYQTKVDIVRRRQGGVVHIYFHTEEELIRLYDRMIEGNDGCLKV